MRSFVLFIFLFLVLQWADGRIVGETKPQFCPLGMWPYDVVNYDGYIQLTCYPLPYEDCDEKLIAEFRTPPICDMIWRNSSCPPRHYVHGVRPVFEKIGEGNLGRLNMNFQLMCCKHQILMTRPVTYTTMSLSPEKRKRMAKDVTSRRILFVSSIGQSSKYDEHLLRVGEVRLTREEGKCRRKQERKNKPKTPDDPSKASAGSGDFCFPADSTVETMVGIKRMDEVEVGDKILATSWDGRTSGYQEVRFFLHREPETLAEFLTISTESGNAITLSPNHLLPIFPCETGPQSKAEAEYWFIMNAVFASRAEPGLCLLRHGADGAAESVRITKVTSETKPGIYAPVTSSGAVVVDGIQASCYASIENHFVLHNFFAMANRLTELFQGLFSGMEPSGEIPLAVRVMQSVFVLASGV